MSEILLNPYQDRFIFTKARFPALVAAIGTGKTMALILRAMREMEDFSNNLGVIVRKEFTDLRDSTIRDFEDYTGLKVGSNKNVILPNKSILMFRHGAEINVLKNLNLGFAGIEQAEEFETDNEHTFLRDRMRRKNSRRCLGIIANTNGHNWIHKKWKVNAQRDPEFDLSEATTYDNARNLPADYIADLEKMKVTHPEHYRRLVMNSWDDVDTVDVIIKPEFVRQAVNANLKVGRYKRRVVVCDPARYGDDETVIYALDTGKVIETEIYRQKSTMETAGYIIKVAEKQGIQEQAVDTCGLGAGIADRLLELNRQVIQINSAEKSNFENKYRNLRAEMWTRAAELFEAGDVSIPEDEELIEQLSAVRYKTIESNGRLQVEGKEDVKKRLGRSPDRADCLVMGLWAQDRVKVGFKSDYGMGEGKSKKYNFNPMTV